MYDEQARDDIAALKARVSDLEAKLETLETLETRLTTLETLTERNLIGASPPPSQYKI